MGAFGVFALTFHAVHTIRIPHESPIGRPYCLSRLPYGWRISTPMRFVSAAGLDSLTGVIWIQAMICAFARAGVIGSWRERIEKVVKDQERVKIAPLRRHVLLSLGLALLAISFLSTAADAQELTPRAYWPAPKGTNVVTFGYQFSTGDVVTDPTLPITGVESRNNFAQITYQYTFNLFGRTANATFSLPYVWGITEGFVDGEYRSRRLSGIGDARARLSVNFFGAPTMDVAEFQALRAKPRTIIGASLLVQAPTGGYEPDKLINVGANRWAVNPGLGLIWPVRPTWLVELEVGAWLFGDNDDFLGVTREQAPILSTEFHLVKRFKPGFWAAFDMNYYTGGRTTVDQELKADLQRNSRIGGTLLFPFKSPHTIRFSYSTGIVTESGGDFNQFNLTYLFAWQ